MKQVLTGCLSMIVAFLGCTILFFMLGSHVIPKLAGQSKFVKINDTHLNKDPFYTCCFSNAKPSYDRLPLVKPFALIAFTSSHTNWILVNNGHTDTRIEWNMFLNNNIKGFFIHRNFLITRSITSFDWQPPQKVEWWTIYNLNTPEDYDGKEIIWYNRDFNSQSEAESFYNMLFTDKSKFLQRLAELKIPLEIQWLEPDDCYKKYIKTGYCQWFPVHDPPLN